MVGVSTYNGKREKHEMSEGFLRQRRNLIITSLILLIIDYGGIVIEKISFVGVFVKLNDPDTLKTILAMFSIYFFIRYIQYYSHNSKNFEEINILNNKKMGVFFKKKAENMIKLIFSKEASFYHGFREEQSFYTALKKSKWKIKIDLDKDNKSSIFIKIKRYKFIKPYLKAKIAFSTNQLITDYYLPPMLFLITVTYHIEKNYHFFEKIALQLSNLNILILGTILLLMLLFVFYRRIKLELFT